MPFSNGRREGANPSSRVIVLPSLESQTFVVDQLCCFKLGISIPNLKTCIPGDQSHTYRKDLWRLHFNFYGHPSRAGNRYDNPHYVNSCVVEDKFDSTYLDGKS